MNSEISINWIKIFEGQKIYLYGLNGPFKKIADKLVSEGNYEFYNDISKNLKINQRSFYYYIRGERPIDINCFTNLISLANNTIDFNFDYNKHSFKEVLVGGGSRKNLIKLPLTINSNLAYLVGYLFGDGCIKSNEWTINFCDEYFEQIDLINDLFFKLFKIKGVIMKTGDNRYELNIYSKVLAIFFNKLFQMPIGIKNKIRMPPILKTSRELSVSFLRGFSDADGGLPRMEEYETIPKWILSSPNIEVASKYKEILLDLKEVFINQDIKPNLYYHKNNNSFRLIVSGKGNIVKCKNFKMFNHPLKKRRLKSLVETFSPRWLSMVEHDLGI